MRTDLQDAKSQLTERVQTASDVVPKYAEWASELAEVAEGVRVPGTETTPQTTWDDLREDRHENGPS